MTYLSNLKKLGVKSTVLASSLALVACGGGGSDGYFDNSNTNNGNGNGNGNGEGQTPIKEAAALVLSTFDEEGKEKSNINKNGDTLVVKLKAADADGGGIEGKKIKLTITDFQKYGITSDASEKVTDEQGYASFVLTVPKMVADIQKITITGNIVGTTISQVKLIGISGSTEAVAQSKLEAIFDPVGAINVTGGTTVVKIRAKDVNGGGVAGQKMALALPKELQNIFRITGTAEQITDVNGYASYSIQLINGKEADRQEILKSGILLSATLTDTEGAVATQNTNVQIRSSVSIVDQVIFDTDLSNNKISASNGNASIRIKVLNPEGLAVKKQKVNLEIVDTVKMVAGEPVTNNAAALGASIISPMIVTDDEGYATFTVVIGANDKFAQQTLAEFGVSLKATVIDPIGKTITQQHKLTAISNMNESVTQLTFLTQQLDITEGNGKIVIKAIDEYGGVVSGQSVSLKINDSEKLGVVSNSSSSLVTNDKGEVSFDMSFIKLNDEALFKELMNKGLTIVATHVNTKNQTITQTHTVKLTSQNNNTSTTVERLEIKSDIGTVAATGNNKVKFTVTAFNGDGTKAINQRIGLGLNEVAVQNGVTFTSGQIVTTNSQGIATFEINVNAQNLDAIKNLVESGITLAAQYKRTDGTFVNQLYRVQVTEPATSMTLVDALVLKPSATSISGFGGEVTVAVQAVDAQGKGIEGKTVALALPSNVSSRVKVNNSSAITNVQGYAYFTVSVTPGSIDEALVKAGITYAVTTINSSNGSTISQVNKISVTVPQQALDVSLNTLRQTVSEAGDNLDINIKVASNDINVAGYPVAMEVLDSNLTGVKLDAISYSVDANGNAKAVLTVPNNLTDVQRQKLLTDGINVKATITLPNGEKRGKTLKLTVVEVVNTNHLSVTINRTSIVNTGGNSLVTVKLLDANNGGVANQPIQLAVAGNSSASINGASSLITNEFGEATFDVKLLSTTNLNAITLTATNKNSAGKNVQQVGQIGIHQATGLAPLLGLKLTGSKDKLNVRGDAIEVAVLVTDLNGSSQIGKAVTLSIPAYAQNGAYIRGASTVESDENGWAKFTVVVDESLRATNYPANSFVTDDLIVLATVKDENSTETRQRFSLDVVNSEVPESIGSIAVNLNPTAIASTQNGVYYQAEGSVQLVDVDGKPIANQDVVLDTRPLTYWKGSWRYEITKSPWDDETPPKLVGSFPFDSLKGWVAPGGLFYALNGTVPAQSLSTNPSIACTANTSTWSANNQPLRVVRFIGSDASHPATATYRTDSYGRFDFQIEYPKANATWLQIEIGAKATLAKAPAQIRATTNYLLPALGIDFASNGAYAPNKNSPYGVNTTVCP